MKKINVHLIINIAAVLIVVLGALLVEARWKGKIEERINNNITTDDKREERLLTAIEELKKSYEENTKAINSLEHEVKIIRIFVEGKVNNVKKNSNGLVRRNK